jgi:hypothetical protein
MACEPQEPDVERRTFFDSFNQRWAELRADPKAWTEIVEERQAFDAALSDDLG